MAVNATVIAIGANIDKFWRNYNCSAIALLRSRLLTIRYYRYRRETILSVAHLFVTTNCHVKENMSQLEHNEASQGSFLLSDAFKATRLNFI